jgi:hypothetical protein
VSTLRDRLPADLDQAPSGPDFDALPFTSLYLLDNEWAAEIANKTVHGVMHLGLVSDQAGGYRAQMAVLVKPNGLFGTAYQIVRSRRTRPSPTAAGPPSGSRRRRR